MKSILLAIAAFTTAFMLVGLATEAAFKGLSEIEWPQDGPPASGQFIQAQRHGEPIHPRPQDPADEGQAQARVPQERCSAVNLSNRAHPHFLGTVTDVIDGDTVNMRVEGAHMRVRLWGIDAPENNQPSGSTARQVLQSLTPVNSKAEIHPVEMDQYGRIVGVLGKGQDWSVNVLMVAHGWAYHVDAFDSEGNPCLREAEKTARAHRMGVWRNGQNGGIRPWAHRKNEIQQRQQLPQGREGQDMN